MIAALPDRDGIASRAAAEGKFALGTGDTELAAKKFAEAGAVLEKEEEAARKSSDKNFLRFLAASQYFYGGHYEKALKLSRRVEERRLPERVRPLFGPFFGDVKLRAAPGYATRIDQMLSEAWVAGEYGKVLDILKDHPYVLDPGSLAFVRAGACEELGQWRAAALFYAAAIRSRPDDLAFVFSPSAIPLQLLSQNQMREAKEYVQHQVELFPHPVTLLTASIVALQQAASESPSERGEEPFGQLDRAWEAYRRLPESQQRDPEMLRYIALGLSAGAATAIRLRDVSRAKELLEWLGRFGSGTDSTRRTTEHLHNFLKSVSGPAQAPELSQEVVRAAEQDLSVCVKQQSEEVSRRGRSMLQELLAA